MLCECCHQQEATVHVTKCNGSKGELMKHDYCEACAVDPQGGGIPPRALRGGWTSYGPEDTRTDEQ